MAAIWDPRLLSRERAVELAAGWRLWPQNGHMFCVEPRWPGNRRNERCGQLIARGPFSFEDLLEAILRHAVAAHDLNLNPDRRTHDREDGPHPAHRGWADRSGVAGGPAHRYPDQEPDPRRSPGSAPGPGGDAA